MSKHKSNDYYRNLYEHADEVVSREDIELLELRTLRTIKEVCYKYKNICVGYSAGKESLAIMHLMNKTACNYTPVIWRTFFQYPAVTRWIEANKPNNLVSVEITRPNWEDLEKQNGLLFCKTPADNNWWMAKKWNAQKKYFADNGVDLFVTGRRLGDGNNCGTKGSNFVRKSKSYDIFSPIADWSEEQLFAYMKYNGITLPPNYFYELGFINGSGAWAERLSYGNAEATEYEQWEAIYKADPQILREATKHLTSAREFASAKALCLAQEEIKNRDRNKQI